MPSQSVRDTLRLYRPILEGRSIDGESLNGLQTPCIQPAFPQPGKDNIRGLLHAEGVDR